MNVAILTNAFEPEIASGRLSTGQLIRRLGTLGVRAVELMDSLVADDEIRTLPAVLADANASVIGLSAGCDLITPAGPERAAQIARAVRTFDRAARVGARMVLLYAERKHLDVPPDVARRWLGETLASCIEEAMPLGVQVTIESLGLQPAVCCRSEHLATICEATGPGLKLTYDCGNPLLGGEDPLASLDRLANRMVHVHFKDWTVVEPPVQPDPYTYPGGDGRWFRGAVLGEGVVDLPGVLARLQALGFDGHISVEYEGVEEPWPAIERGLQYLRSLDLK